MEDMNPISFTLFKKKGALFVKPMYPEERNGYLKAGGYMITFQPADEHNDRSYDSERAISFLVGAGETMTFVNNLLAGDGMIYHDPDKGSNKEGTRAKTLIFGNGDGGKVFLNILSNGNKIVVSLTQDEADLLVVLMKSTVNRLYAW